MFVLFFNSLVFSLKNFRIREILHESRFLSRSSFSSIDQPEVDVALGRGGSGREEKPRKEGEGNEEECLSEQS